MSVYEATVRRVIDDAVTRVVATVTPDLPEHVTYRDLTIGLREMWFHVNKNTPEILSGHKSVLDIGPGVGLFSVIAEELGNSAMAVDRSAMTDVTRAYRAVTESLGVRVEYASLNEYLQGWRAWDFGQVDFVHARGSLDAVFLPYFSSGTISSQVLGFLELISKKMPKGGTIWIGHNRDPVSDAIMAVIDESIFKNFEVAQNSDYITKLVRK